MGSQANYPPSEYQAHLCNDRAFVRVKTDKFIGTAVLVESIGLFVATTELPQAHVSGVDIVVLDYHALQAVQTVR